VNAALLAGARIGAVDPGFAARLEALGEQPTNAVADAPTDTPE
jgi:hypothetical protein